MDDSKDYKDFIDSHMPEWIRTTIIKEMKAFAAAAGLPDQFIAGITLSKISKGYRITNTWVKDGKPLADFFEFGTVDHYIKPKNPKGVLAWKAPGSAGEHHGSAIYYQSGKPRGEIVFSKGHYVSGIERSDAMQRGYDRGIIQLKILIKSNSEKYLRSKGFD